MTVIESLELFANKYNRTKMKTLYSFINAVLFCKNQATENKSPTGSISLLLYNILIVIVTGTHSVCFAERQTYFFQRKIGIEPVIFQESN